MRHALDLVLTVQYLVHALPREAQRWGAVMLAVGLPEPHLVGHDGLRMYVGRATRPFVVQGPSKRAFLASFAGVEPVVEPGASLHRFDVDGAGPVDGRLHPLPASGVPLVRRLLGDAAELVARWRARLDERAAQLGEVEAWRRCPICNPLPDAFPFWQGTQLAEWYLPIVDGPDSADLSDRGECTKRCPWCATTYRWRSDYEYLVNGASESETTLTRLA